MAALITAPIVAGRCPFDAEAPPAAGVTPATHFALARGPASDTAVLLRFATHRWHSRLVAALKEDAAAHGSLATAEQFVLVVPPEPIRDDVVPVLVELLELQGPVDADQDGAEEENTAADGALSRTEGAKHAGQKLRSHVLKSPHHVADVCQLCRLGEFLQCNTITAAAVGFLDEWLDSVTDSGHDPAYVRLLLKLLCSADIGQVASAEDQFEEADPIPWYRTPPVDLAFMRTLVDDGDDCVVGHFSRWIAPHVRAYIPPCAVPRRVATSYFVNRSSRNEGRRKREREDEWERNIEIACGLQSAPPAPTYLFVTARTAVEDYPDCILHFFSADHLTPLLNCIAKGVVLPPGCDFETVFDSELLLAATFVTLPADVDDDALALFDPSVLTATILRLSSTKITKIPPHWCTRDVDLEEVHFPPTLKSIGQTAFAHCAKLRLVTGLEGVDIAPTAFSNSQALSPGVFIDAACTTA